MSKVEGKAAYEKIELSSRWYIKCFFKSTYWHWKILNIQLGKLNSRFIYFKTTKSTDFGGCSELIHCV